MGFFHGGGPLLLIALGMLGEYLLTGFWIAVVMLLVVAKLLQHFLASGEAVGRCRLVETVDDGGQVVRLGGADRFGLVLVPGVGGEDGLFGQFDLGVLGLLLA